MPSSVTFWNALEKNSIHIRSHLVFPMPTWKSCVAASISRKVSAVQYHGFGFREDQMLNVCGDFYGAGQETTTTTLRWAMLFLAQYQDVQVGEKDNACVTVSLKKFSGEDESWDCQRCRLLKNTFNEWQAETSLCCVSCGKRQSEMNRETVTVCQQSQHLPALQSTRFKGWPTCYHWTWLIEL